MTGPPVEPLERAVQTAGAARARALERFHELGDELADAMREAAAAGVGFNALERATAMSPNTVARILASTAPASGRSSAEARAVVDELVRKRARANASYARATERLAAAATEARERGVAVTRLQALSHVSRPTLYALIAGDLSPNPARAGRRT